MMAAILKENVQPQIDSKNPKKRKAKAGVSTPASIPSQAVEEPKEDHVNGDANNESAYLKELHKNIRNLKKKIAASSKVESILAENQGKTAADLLASRVINADQKAQLDKKPALVAQLENYETQYEQYKKLDEEYQQKLNTEKESLAALHSEEIEKVKANIRAEVDEEHKELFNHKLLVLSQFLRTAAAKRSEEDGESDDAPAFEGALLLVYGGDESAVRAMEKLIAGTEDKVPGVDSQETDFTFKHVRDVSTTASPVVPNEDASNVLIDGTAEPVASDPTIANAGLTELDDNTIVTNGHSHEADTTNVPEAATIEGGANEVAEAQWNKELSQSITSGPDGFEIVEHPRDPKETETGLDATPAAPSGTQSWAEDVPIEAPVISSTPTPADDGFHEVSHRSHRGRGGQGEHRGEHRGRGNGSGGGGGGYRGRGRGDGSGRGRGFRGDGRGRGRGEGRGSYRGRGESRPAATATIAAVES